MSGDLILPDLCCKWPVLSGCVQLNKPHVGRQFDKIWLGPDGRKRHQNQDPIRDGIRDGQAAKKMAKTASLYILNRKIRVYFQGKTLAEEALKTKTG